MDEQLRKEERDAAASPGDVPAEARKIQGLLRAGRLNPDRVRLAAHLGNAAAQLVTGYTPPDRIQKNLRWWLVSLGPWGKPVLVRAALAATTQTLLRLGFLQGDVQQYVWGIRAHHILARVNAWLDSPSEERRQEIKVILDQMRANSEESSGQAQTITSHEEMVMRCVKCAYYKTFPEVRVQAIDCVYTGVEDLLRRGVTRAAARPIRIAVEYARVRIHGNDSTEMQQLLKTAEREYRWHMHAELLRWAMTEVVNSA